MVRRRHIDVNRSHSADKNKRDVSSDTVHKFDSRTSRERGTSLLVTLVLVVAFVFGAASVAIAGTACSADGFYSNNGVSYKGRSCINTNHASNHQAYSVTLVYVTGGTAPTGWAGALPRRWNDTGTTLLCTGTWTYNSSPMTSASAPINPAGCFNHVHSAYSSKGQTRAFNGSGYSTYVTFLSPAQNS